MTFGLDMNEGVTIEAAEKEYRAYAKGVKE